MQQDLICKELPRISNHMGMWTGSVHPKTELCFIANVSFCLCNLQTFVSVASKLTALQNSLHLNEPHCPSFIYLSNPKTLSWLGKVSRDCRYSWCYLHSLRDHLSSCCSAQSPAATIPPALSLMNVSIPFGMMWLSFVCASPSFIWLSSPWVLPWQVFAAISELVFWQVMCGKVRFLVTNGTIWSVLCVSQCAFHETFLFCGSLSHGTSFCCAFIFFRRVVE